MTSFDETDMMRAFLRAADALDAQRDHLQRLDQASGDGDLGITAGKIAVALRDFVATGPSGDVGKTLAAAGMAINRAASSTLGTLLATALMRAGKEAKGRAALDEALLVVLLKAADQSIQERGKAQLGDKTLVDALHPAALAFAEKMEGGAALHEAAAAMIAAAKAGRDSVTPLRSRIGRASWQGERTAGQVDPGCAALVILFTAVVG